MLRRVKVKVARLVLVSGVLLVLSVPALSQEAEQEKINTQTNVQEARYRLRDTTLSDKISDSSASQEELLQKFEWKQIAKNGPATGALPSIGAHSGKPYVDFRDGLNEPESHSTR
jgi:hypothetical protein